MKSPEIVGHVAGGGDLSQAEMAAAMDQIMRGEWSDEAIGLLLTGLHHKGETAEEIAGAAEALRRHMTPLRSRHTTLVDTCGTGGDGSGTFNISTAAALVLAATGTPVAKHGNRSITSRTGSADVLRELGVNVDAGVEQAERCLDRVGICFCFAPLFHQSMRHVAQIRRALGFRTIFNLLGPLCNPAGATCQVLGVGSPDLRPRMAKALRLLGTQRSLVVSGNDGLDEVTLRGPTQCSWVTPDETREFTWSPVDFGLEPTTDFSSLMVQSPAESAAIIHQILDDTPGPARDIVVMNAAAGLWVAQALALDEGVRRSAEAIRSGAARDVLQRLADESHR